MLATFLPKATSYHYRKVLQEEVYVYHGGYIEGLFCFPYNILYEAPMIHLCIFYTKQTLYNSASSTRYIAV